MGGKRFNYAGDELSPSEMATAMSEASGRPFTFERQPIEEVRSMMEDMALMYEWFDEVGYTADIAELRASFPEVEWMSFGDWARTQDWSVVAPADG